MDFYGLFLLELLVMDLHLQSFPINNVFQEHSNIFIIEIAQK